MALDRELLGRIRSLDEFDLRRLLIFARGLLEGRTGDPATPRAQAIPAAAGGSRRETYRQQLVRCGKAGCTRCPHGPYWYAYWREDGRLRSRYLGRTEPPPGSRGGPG